MAFLRASWAREMLGQLPQPWQDVPGEADGACTTIFDAAVSPSAGRRMDPSLARPAGGEELVMVPSAGTAAEMLGQTVVYESDFEEEGDEDEEDKGKDAAGETAADRLQHADGTRTPVRTPPVEHCAALDGGSVDEVAAVRLAMRQQLEGGAPAPAPALDLPPRAAEATQPSVRSGGALERSTSRQSLR